MDSDENETLIEVTEAGYPIEIYTDERIAEFLAEDQMTPEQKKKIQEKLRQSRPTKP